MDMQIVGLGQLFERLLNVYESLLKGDVEKGKAALRMEVVLILGAIDGIWLEQDDVERVQQFSLLLIDKIKNIVVNDEEFDCSCLTGSQTFDEYIENLQKKIEGLSQDG